jgi:hemerythrin superfamily protein
MTDTQIATGQDVVTFLKAQHQQIKTLLSEVLERTGEQREEAFTSLRRLLAVHETAEEEIVHPKARRVLDGGDEIVSQRLAEENEGKQALAELEKLDLGSTEFETKFREFQKDVLEHAEAEEQKEFSRLADELDDDQLQKMRSAVKLAESTAPTHPHPGVESATANLLAGPFAAMMDRAKDMLTGKR